MADAEIEIFDTQATFADACGVSPPTMGRWLKLPDCPVNPAPPWDADDRDSFTDWRSARQHGNADGGDALRRAQALKTTALTVRYTLDAARDLAQSGTRLMDIIRLSMRAASTVHYRNCQHAIGDLLRKAMGGEIEDRHVDEIADDFLRSRFYTSWAEAFASILAARSVADDYVSPLVPKVRQLAADLELLGDVDEAMLAEIDKALDAAGVGTIASLFVGADAGDETDKP